MQYAYLWISPGYVFLSRDPTRNYYYSRCPLAPSHFLCSGKVAVLAPPRMCLAYRSCLWVEPGAPCWGSQELSQAGRQGVPSPWLEAWVSGIDDELSCSP